MRIGYAALFGTSLLLSISAEAKFQAKSTFHGDRGTPHIQILTPNELAKQRDMLKAASSSPQVLKPLDTVWVFLGENAPTYGLTPDLSNLALVGEQETLLGRHYRFQQLLGGRKVAGGEITVYLDKQGRVYQVVNDIYPVTAAKASRAADARITQDAAYDVAWKRLGAKGDPENGLLGEPSADLVYLFIGDYFRLVYDIRLYVVREKTDGRATTGLWQVIVDAVEGNVIGEPVELSTRDQKQPGDASYSTEAGDRLSAFDKFRARKIALMATADLSSSKANGKGQVFDPDPATRLNDPNLADDSPLGAFKRAYVGVILLDLAVRNEKYSLDGPWVSIRDFEPPATQPSTTIDGNWGFERADNAFNDVMTYYHIDQSQRYVQSLGFKGARAIQGASIEADSDGVDGDDNSHYVPGANRLAFGHGCIDDNEDADVILHEYGHAMTHAINPSWGGGDSRAIGEGFGDYWAESYSHTRKNGATFKLDRVFDWDGSTSCAPWTGRSVKLTGVKYDPNRTYGDHESIGGGAVSDELWSTPLFQSYLELVASGHAREEVDRVVLESMFQLAGPGFSMRDLATITVRTAKTLYPNGPHEAVFLKNFRALGIIEP